MLVSPKMLCLCRVPVCAGAQPSSMVPAGEYASIEEDRLGHPGQSIRYRVPHQLMIAGVMCEAADD